VITPSGLRSCEEEAGESTKGPSDCTYVLVLEVNHMRSSNAEPALLPALVNASLLDEPPSLELLHRRQMGQNAQRGIITTVIESER
jgi:hypothetical protein